MIKSMYQASEACVRVDGEVSEWSEVKQGVRQGCPLSPCLFNIFLGMVVKEARTNFHGGVKLDTCQVQVLLFADDTVLITEREEDLQHNIRMEKCQVVPMMTYGCESWVLREKENPGYRQQK